MSRGSTLTTTSFAILGLLAVRPWSTYELTRQMDRSLGRIWPRAQSKLYEEPKKLVELGLAEASTEPVGRRPRTVYAITPAGRRALAGWLAEPGSRAGARVRAAAEDLLRRAGQPGRRAGHAGRGPRLGRGAQRGQPGRGPRVPAGAGPFQHRAAQNLLVGAFLVEFYRMVAEWADWATEQVEQWPEDPSRAVADAGRAGRGGPARAW